MNPVRLQRGNGKDQSVVAAELERRVRGFPVPPDGKFDPSKASREELLYYGLPPRPDRTRQPQAYAAWHTGFGAR
jgi:hypothetical protein